MHLLRELHTLREKATPAAMDGDIQPLMTLLQDALALGQARSGLAASEFAAARRQMENRLDTLIFTRPTDKDCQRINLRRVKHHFDLLRFLEVAGVPPDNNLGEQDIRRVAAARTDGSVNRTKAGATAFANLKSIVRTCQKHGRNVLSYGLTLIGLDEQSQQLPIPSLATTPG